jgi:DNA-binding response OmpR family regulator
MAKIIVIDDAQDAREFVMQALSDEHEVVALENWTQIKDHLVEGHVDLILLDINMPGFKGDKVADLLLKSDHGKSANIVLFSALDEYSLRQKAQKAGAAGYISKTFDEKLLKVRVRRYLRKKSNA